jgi:hypothetical protein
MRTTTLLLLLGLALAAPAIADDAAVVAPEFVVYYFHGTFRCETCRKIEAWAKDAVGEGFVREMKAGNLDWRVVNIQEEPNEHFADEYKLSSQAVVVTQWQDGKVIRWKNLDEVWDHLESKQGFCDYITGEVAGFLKPGK